MPFEKLDVGSHEETEPPSEILSRELEELLSDSKEVRNLQKLIEHNVYQDPNSKKVYKYYNIQSFVYGEKAMINFRRVRPELVKQYFQTHSRKEIHKIMGPKMENVRILSNWRLIIARVLYRSGYRGQKKFGEKEIIGALNKVLRHREKLQGLPLLAGCHVLYIAGSEKITDQPSFAQLSLDAQKQYIKTHGIYRFGLRSREALFKDVVGPEHFTMVHLEQETLSDSTRKIFDDIANRRPPPSLRIVLDGHATKEYFKSTKGTVAFHVDKLVEAFVRRYTEYGSEIKQRYSRGDYTCTDMIYFLHCVGPDFRENFYKKLSQRMKNATLQPAGFTQEETGQDIAGITNVGFFKHVLRLGTPEAQKTTLNDIISLDEREKLPEDFPFNFFLTVPDLDTRPFPGRSFIPITFRGPSWKGSDDTLYYEKKLG